MALFGVGGAGIVALLMSMNPVMLTEYLNEAAASKVAQFGFLFTLAAWLHSGRVKKEIKTQFEIITDAINNVAMALRQDLAAQTKRLDSLEDRLENIEHPNRRL